MQATTTPNRTLTMQQRRVNIRQVCAERGISISEEGIGFRLVGDDTSLFVIDLADVRPQDL